MEPIFNDDKLMTQLNVVHKLRKWLQREKRGYKTRLHRDIGFGLTEAEFEWCIRMLETSGHCIVSLGDKGGVVLTLREPAENLLDVVVQ